MKGTPTPPDAEDRILTYLRGRPEGSNIMQIVVGTQLTESAVRKRMPVLLSKDLVKQERGNRGHGIPDTWWATTQADLALTE